jgi:hypothetical protein
MSSEPPDVMSQMTEGLRSRDNPEFATEVLEELERLKWFPWHGNVFRALQVIDDLLRVWPRCTGGEPVRDIG